MMMTIMLISKMFNIHAVNRHDPGVHHLHFFHGFFIPAAAGKVKDATPYTWLLKEVIQKLQKSSSSARLTYPPLPSASKDDVQKLPSLLFGVHDSDDGYDNDDDDVFVVVVLIMI
jgi:hypothetical protein